MPFIQNISKRDCLEGNHAIPNSGRDILIQISDPPADPPTPHYEFAQVHQFWFDDIEVDEGPHCEQGITVAQANQIAAILSAALAEGRNVIVNCHAYGAKGMEAGMSGNLRPIKTLEDLLWVMNLET